jgi:hypothetical protein
MVSIASYNNKTVVFLTITLKSLEMGMAVSTRMVGEWEMG